MDSRNFTSLIKSNQELASGYFLLSLELPDSVRKPQPGEFFMVKVGKDRDPLLRRPLSLHRLISKDTFQLAYRVCGKGTKILSDRKTGDELDIIGPLGKGFDRPLSLDESILVAGGIGIAPLLSLAEGLRGTTKSVKLFVGGKNKNDILFEKEFSNLGVELFISTEDSSYGSKGLVTELLEDYFKRNGSRFTVHGSRIYACGPRSMLRCLSEIAKNNSIPCFVSLEERMACGVGACLGCAVKIHPLHPPLTKGGQGGGSYRMVCKDGPVFNAEEIDWE